MNIERGVTQQESLDEDQERDLRGDFSNKEIVEVNDILNFTGETVNLEYFNKNIEGESREKIRELMEEHRELSEISSEDSQSRRNKIAEKIYDIIK